MAAPPRGEPITLLPAPTPALIVVHITGPVAKPDVYTLPVDSRIQDPIEATGGLLPEADISGLHLAARLIDGSQIRVGSLAPMEVARNPNVSGSGTSSSSKTPATVITPTNTPSQSSVSQLATPDLDSLININTSTQRELET